MYDNKENNFKKKGLCISLCAALVCGLGIGGCITRQTNHRRMMEQSFSLIHQQADCQRMQIKRQTVQNDKKTEENTENKNGDSRFRECKNIKKKYKKGFC